MKKGKVSIRAKDVASAGNHRESGQVGGGVKSVIDNRPLAAMQRRIMEIADNSPQSRQQQAISSMVCAAPALSAQRRQHPMSDVAMPQAAFDTAPGKHGDGGAEVDKSGLPKQLKSGIEAMSGISMADVKVHFNSSQPAQLNALAYAQGTDIHLGPGQEKHLPHEAWHVVQQKQGRVNGTMQMAGITINDDPVLEREADQMGGKAAIGVAKPTQTLRSVSAPATAKPPLQGLFGMEKESRISIQGEPEGVIAAGAGFSVVPDNGNKGKILEFVTVPFDEHTSRESLAFEAFSKQLITIWEMMEEIRVIEDDKPIDEVFTRHHMDVKTSVKRRVHPGDSFKGPVHFTVGMKLESMLSQLAEVQTLSTKKEESKTQNARMSHVALAKNFSRDIEVMATRHWGAGKIPTALAGYFALAFLTVAGWQSSLKLDEGGLRKQIPLAFMKVHPSTALAGIATEAQRFGLPGVIEWVAANAAALQSLAVRHLPFGDAGKRSLNKWLKWLVGQDDGALDMIDQQVTIIKEKETMGTASASPYGYAAELRNITIGDGDASSLGSVRAAGIEVIRMSRGKPVMSQKDLSHTDKK